MPAGQVKTGSRLKEALWASLALAFCLSILGCRVTAKEPVVQLTRVPPAGEGGPDKLQDIEGLVRNAPPGERIVVYAKAGSVWWVQPLATAPFTSIASDGRWKTATHLGTEYGVVLVDPGYQPLATMKALPARGNGISAVTSRSVSPGLPVATQTLKFSGYEWHIRHITSDRNGAISYYDPANAWTDENGALHLRISRDKNVSKCSQVELANNFGYGTYLFTVRNTPHLQPAAALVLFTYDDLATEHHREMDIEMSQWGNPSSKNADYVIQPYTFPENKVVFELPDGEVTHSLRWEPGRATFTSFRGAEHDNVASLIKKNEFTTGIPSPGGESVVIDFCNFKYSKEPLQSGAEAIVERFQYLP